MAKQQAAVAVPAQPSQFAMLELFKPVELPNECVIAVGGEGTGKTHFAGTAPGPLYVIGTERGHEAVTLKKDFPDKIIHHHTLTALRSVPAIWFGAFAGMWQQVEQLIGELSLSPRGTVIIDSGSDLLGIAAVRLNVGLERGDTPIPPMMYGQVYPILGEWIGAIRACHNVVITARTTDEYKANAKTGNMTVDLWKTGPYLSEHIVWLEREPVTGKRFATVTKGWNEGKVVGEPTWDKIVATRIEKDHTEIRLLLSRLYKAFAYADAKGKDVARDFELTAESLKAKIEEIRVLVTPPVVVVETPVTTANGHVDESPY